MDARREALDALGALLAYPGPGFDTTFDEALEVLERVDRATAEGLAPLALRLGASEPTSIEELYTRTFDINPLCTLELGWQLYGEDYNRGAFMVRLRELMREVGVEEGSELPDHLVHVLPVLGRLDDARAADLASGFLLPSLRKMIEGFAEEGNPYRALVEAVRDHIVRAYGEQEIEAGAATVRLTPYTGLPGTTPGIGSHESAPQPSQEA